MIQMSGKKHKKNFYMIRICSVILMIIVFSEWQIGQNSSAPIEEETHETAASPFKGWQKNKEIQDTTPSLLNTGLKDSGTDNAKITDDTQAVWVTPEADETYDDQGITYDNKGEHDKDIDPYTRAVQAFPENDKAYTNRGDVYAEKKEYDRAIDDYTQAIKINPKDDIAYYNRGNAFSEKGEYDKAVEDYTQAILLNQIFDFAYNNRGYAYYLNGEYNRAIDDFTQAISLNPEDGVAYNNMSWILASCPDDNYRDGIKAIEFAKKGLELKPDDPEFSDTLAMAYAEAGKFEDAVKAQEKAIELLDEKDKDTDLSEYTEHLNSYKAGKPWREKPRNNHAKQ